ncbi:uncharacterized protein Bfra_003324 [Botrytis fragariae]|uniref:LysM domain-containing protein n=1 Tax=Botrytis fragariae TaxID=1964551 RepID=A0A8H6EK70_9HELO|nr:uncharacterized protein Bfra_003324 [Botrytis fragariae]KAF5874875.1 hypothetical protein Bfra_003324 [Botrytis fragariae]
MKGIISSLLICVGAVQASVLDLLPRLLQPESNIVERANATTTGDCSLHTIQSGDTCFTIASANNVTWAQLTSWNSDLTSTCSNLQDLASVCVTNPLGTYAMPTNTVGVTSIVTAAAALPTAAMGGSNTDCGQWYQIQGDGDYCDYMSETFDISLSDFLFLNPEVWANCTNLWAGSYYCVEPVGYISTYPGYGQTTTTVPFSQTPTTTMPYIGSLFGNYTTSDPVIPLANGTRIDCYGYIWFNSTDGNEAADCWNLATVFGNTALVCLTLAQILGEKGDQLAPSSSYCINYASSTSVASAVITPQPLAAGETVNCTQWFAPQSYNTCEDILVIFNLNITQFYDWNPSVGSDCVGMDLGTYYCVSIFPGGQPPSEPDPDGDATPTSTSVSTPSPIPTDTVSNCDKFVEVVSGNTCEGVYTAANITFATFLLWNPSIGSGCQFLDLNEYYCVGVSGTTSATAISSTTATSMTAISTPSPIPTDTVSNCDAFVEVVTGNTCQSVLDAANLDLATFYSWNPSVGPTCEFLDLNEYYCVGISAAVTTTSAGSATAVSTPSPVQTGIVSDCDQFYEVETNDSCEIVVGKYGITLDEFYSWNPAIGSSCQFLELNVYVCVGIS